MTDLLPHDTEAAIYLILVWVEAAVIAWLTWTLATDAPRGRHER